MKSVFKYGAYVLAFIVMMFSAAACFTLSMFFWLDGVPAGLIVMVVVVVLLMWAWLFYGELRTKVIAVTIGYDNFTVKRYFGLGKAQTYYFKDAEGFLLSILPANYVVYEYLYVMQGGKKVIKLSQFYHKNYEELKAGIEEANIKYLGEENFSYGREIKEIFQ